ncbi:hypothetical protein ACF08B_06655 [Streptomyces sp. NPDC015139]|uniref:hypothetical protein n=1 Tax=Streptomyces sp. NPDC015139 TaxID=3364942 RepID=UPI0036F98117
MTTIDVTTAQRFVAELELAETPRALAELSHTPITLTTEKSAAVDDGSIVCFADGLDIVHKQDVLNSTLLAQLAASNKYDRETETEEWYGYYKHVLENVGWVTSEWRFSKYEASTASFHIDTVILQILVAIATGNELALAIATLEALKKSSDSRAGKLFETQSHGLSNGSFQMGCASPNGDNVGMALAAFHFSTTSRITKILWTDFNATQTKLYQGGQTVVLNEQLYSVIRADVIKKLGDKAKQFVADIEI